MNEGHVITCPLCRTQYSEADGERCHTACPLHRRCRLLSCPACGYEVPAPTWLTRWLARWLGVSVNAG